MKPKGMAVSRTNDPELQAYNNLVLQNQDEAFSLAYELLGEDHLAVAVVQQVFLKGFTPHVDARLPFRLRVLHWVVRACLKRGQALPGPARLDPHLAPLSNEEKIILVLVDRLGLNYSQAAAVAGKSVADIRIILAAARFSLLKMS